MDFDAELAAVDAYVRTYRAMPDESPIVECTPPADHAPGSDGLAGLSRDDTLRRLIVLTRLLRAEVTTSHYHVWRFCAEYFDAHAADDGFAASAAVFFGTLVPPQTEIDAHVRHALLGPLGFALVEGALRRWSGGYLRGDGSVLQEFTVDRTTYTPSDLGEVRCLLLGDAWLLQQQQLSRERPPVAQWFEALGTELLVLLDAEGRGLARELDAWREAWFGKRHVRNAVPMLANTLAFLVLAHLSDDDYADARALREDLAATA
jgi:hypothetical protein